VEGVVPALVIVEALEGRDAVAVDRPAVDDLELHLLPVTGSGGVDEHHADDPVRTHHQFVQLRPPGVTGPFGLGLDECEDAIGAQGLALQRPAVGTAQHEGENLSDR